jgi:hypothetical protein
LDKKRDRKWGLQTEKQAGKVNLKQDRWITDTKTGRLAVQTDMKGGQQAKSRQIR